MLEYSTLSEEQKNKIEQLLKIDADTPMMVLTMMTGATEPTIADYLAHREQADVNAAPTIILVDEPLDTYLPDVNMAHYHHHPIFNTTFAKSHLYEAIRDKPESSAIGAIYEKRHEHRKHRGRPNSEWLGKVGGYKLLHQQDRETLRTLNRRQINADAIMEFIAHSAYGVFADSYEVPKLKLAYLPLVNEYTREHFFTTYYQQTHQLDNCLQVMSKWVDDFVTLNNVYAIDEETQEPLCVMSTEANQINYIEKNGRPPEQVIDPDSGQPVPFRGLMELLAVGSTIADTDVLGGGGKNAGVVFHEMLDGSRQAVVVNIDPGFAFNFQDGWTPAHPEDEDLTPTFGDNQLRNYRLDNERSRFTDAKDIQLGNNSGVIQWALLTDDQRLTYLEAKRTVLQVLSDDEVLDKLFLRDALIQTNYAQYNDLVEDYAPYFFDQHRIFDDNRQFSLTCANPDNIMPLNQIMDEGGHLIANLEHLNESYYYIEFHFNNKTWYLHTFEAVLNVALFEDLQRLSQARVISLTDLIDYKEQWIHEDITKQTLKEQVEFIELYAKGKKRQVAIDDLAINDELFHHLNTIHHGEYKLTHEDARTFRDRLTNYVALHQEIFADELNTYEAEREQHLNQVLFNTLNQTLKSRYRHAGVIKRVMGEEPLPLAECYTHLALVKEVEKPQEDEEHDSEHNDSPQESQLGLLGNHEDIHAHKQPIDFDELFDFRDGKDIKKLLVLGRAGIGKSTFCQKIVHDWGRGALWDNLFDVVFWIKLRDITPERFPPKTDGSAYTTAEFIQSLCFDNRITLTVEHLAELHHQQTILYLLDGFDETTHLHQPNNAYLKLTFEALLTESDYQLITSRPYERRDLKKLHFDGEVEITGFTPEDIHTFITNPRILEDPNHQQSLSNFLRTNPPIQTQCQVPIQLDLLTSIWASQGEAMMAEGTLTLPDLYQRLAIHLRERFYHKQGVAPDKVSHKLTNQANIIEQALAHIAYEGMLARQIILPNRIIDQAAHKKDLICREIFNYGLLQPIGGNNMEERDGFFLHLTYQEYFAARYLIHQWQEKNNPESIKTFIKDHRYDDTYEMVFIFLAGLMTTEDKALQLFDWLTQHSYHEARYPHKNKGLALKMLGNLATEFMAVVNNTYVYFGEGIYVSQMIDSYYTSTSFNYLMNIFYQYPNLIKQFPGFLNRLFNDVRNIFGEVHSDSNDDGGIALEMVEILCQFNKVAMKGVLSMLDDNNANVREIFIQIIGHSHCKDTDVIESLLPYLKDPNVQVRRATVHTLGQAGCVETYLVDGLIEAMDDEVIVRQEATLALGRIGCTQPVVIDTLLDALCDDNQTLTRYAADAFIVLDCKEPRIIESLLGILMDVTWSQLIRSQSAIILGKLQCKTPHVIDSLLAALKEVDEEVSYSAVTALGYLDCAEPRVIECLLDVLVYSNTTMKCIVLKALGSLGYINSSVIEHVLIALCDDNHEVREQAARVLGQLRCTDDKVINYMMIRLGDENYRVRQALVNTLSQLVCIDDRVMYHLFVRLEGDIHHVSQLVGDSLRRLGCTYKKLISQMEKNRIISQSYANYEVFADTLSQLGCTDDRVMRHLATATFMNDANDHARRAIVDILSNIGRPDDEMIAVLVEMLRHDDYGVRQSAAEVLGQLGCADESVIDGLTVCLGDNKFVVRQEVANALGKLGCTDESVIEKLVASLGDENWRVRKNAAEALGQLGHVDERVIEGLIARLGDEDSRVRRMAASALGQLGCAEEQVIDGLIACLGDDDNQIRRSAVQALGQIGCADEQVIKSLVACLSDGNRRVRQNAAIALGQLGHVDERVIEGLVARLGNQHSGVRQCAAEALVQLGCADERVIEELFARLGDESGVVRRHASQVLENLGISQQELDVRQKAMLIRHGSTPLLNQGYQFFVNKQPREIAIDAHVPIEHSQSSEDNLLALKQTLDSQLDELNHNAETEVTCTQQGQHWTARFYAEEPRTAHEINQLLRYAGGEQVMDNEEDEGYQCTVM